MVLFLKRLIPKSITDIQTLAETRMEENIYLTNHYLSVSFVGSSSSDFFLKLMFCGILFFSPQYALSLSKFLSLYGLQLSHYTGQSQTVFLVQMAPSILSIEPTQHLYPAISCSSQKQFIQNKMYHLSFFSLFTYLPLKKKKRYHNDILWPSQIARHYLDSALCLSLTIQSAHPCCLPLWHTSQPCN